MDQPILMDADLDGDGVLSDFSDTSVNPAGGARRIYYHQNALGSVAAITDTAGGIIEAYRYDAYGTHYRLTPTSPSTTVQFNGSDTVVASGASLFDNPYLYTGRRFDPETGLLYYRARYYEPERGRFLSHDPIGAFGDPANLGNPYAYCGNMPGSASDPMGLMGTGPPAVNPDGTINMAALGGKYSDGIVNLQKLPGNVVLAAEDAVRASVVAGGQFAKGVVKGTVISIFHTINAAAHPIRTIQQIGAALGTYAGDPAAANQAIMAFVLNIELTPEGLGEAVGSMLGGAIAGGGIGKVLAVTSKLGVSAAKVTRCSFLKKGCFPAGTQVMLADGSTTSIEEIEIGDVVLADDPRDEEEPKAYQVTALLRTGATRLIHIAVDADGDGESDGEISATEGHPFWTQDRGWRPAVDVRPGDRLQDDELKSVVALAVWEEQTTVNGGVKVYQ